VSLTTLCARCHFKTIDDFPMQLDAIGLSRAGMKRRCIPGRAEVARTIAPCSHRRIMDSRPSRQHRGRAYSAATELWPPGVLPRRMRAPKSVPLPAPLIRVQMRGQTPGRLDNHRADPTRRRNLSPGRVAKKRGDSGGSEARYSSALETVSFCFSALSLRS
jgi:hypothetical protein